MNLKQVSVSNLIKKVSFAFILSISPFILKAQNIRITYLNTDNYPEIEAGFVATTPEGMKIYNSSVDDFTVSENSRQNKILEVINPKKDYQPVSVVIMIDISISMQGKKLDLVKEGLADFIEQIPLETSEVAIACFSDESYIYTDFTQSKNRLISALNRLKNINGTDFDNAFLNPDQGALAIGKGAKNKKVVIFVTDGLGTTNTEKIADVANNMSASVYALNVVLSIPKDLRALTEKTNGKHFERIVTKSQLRQAASVIFKELECTDYGTVRWLSKLDCEISKPVQLKYKNTLLELDYDVPAEKTGKIEANPSLVQFGAGRVGLEQIQGLRITPLNIPITLTSLETDPKSPFKLADSINFPLKLKPGEQLNTKIKFTAAEAGLYETKLLIKTEECPDASLNLLAGGEEQIKLVFPTGGEVFSVGEDTTIRWEGVKRTQPVDIAYRLKENHKWETLGKGSQLKHLWHLPIDTSSKVQVKLTPLKLADENLEISGFTEGSNILIENLNYSADGSRIVSTDNNGFVKTWNSQNGKIITSLGGYDAKKAMISPDNERLYLFLKDETFVWELSTNRLTGRVSPIGKKVFSSFILPEGSQVLIPANVSIDQAKNARVWSGMFDTKTFLFNQPEIKWAAFTSNSKSTITLTDKNVIRRFTTDSARLVGDLPFKESISSIIISPDGSKALVRIPQGLCMIDLLTMKELFRISQLQFQRFSANGGFFITTDKKLIDSSTGKVASDLTSAKIFEISSQSQYLAFNLQDSLLIYNLYEKRFTLKLANKPFRMARFDVNESKLYILTLNNTMEIYETSTGAFLGVMDKFSRKIRDFVISPANLQLATLMDDNRIEIWSPASSLVMKDAVSGQFTIASPKPMVIDTVQFDEQVVSGTKELNIKKFAWNATKYPLNIKNIVITGDNKADFEIAAKTFPFRLETKSQLDQEFRFRPSKPGITKATIKTYTATDSFTTVIIGKGIVQKILPITRYLDFGKVKVGGFKDTLAPILVNVSAEMLIIRSIKNSGPDEMQFKVVKDQEYKLAPGDTLKAVIRFIPVSRGKTTSTLTFLPSADENRVIMRGEGLSPREIILTGTIRNSADSLPVVATVIKTDLGSDRIMETQTVESNGRYMLKLIADRNFGITAEKENYISTSLNIDLSEKMPADTVYRDIYLTEIKPGAIIRFNCIFFEFDKATLLAGSQSDLKRLHELILKYPQHTFEIHGHTDDAGSDTYNLNLAKARAAAVMNYLIKNGASKENLSIKFFGEKAPVAPNTTEEGRALNRRVEIKVGK
jgi:outer membrane protein OmpA-like peptidoglycan-associated protein/WD40 repeat protein/uncharacterized protein YegL